MRLQRIKSLSCSLIVITSAQLSLAATYHVSPLGSNTPPYSSIATAANHPSTANALATGVGDTVRIHSGDYSIASSIDVSIGVSWVGDDSASTILRWIGSTQPPVWMVSASGDNLFTGLRFLNPNPQNLENLSAITFENTSLVGVVTGCRLDGCKVDCGVLDTLLVYANRFDVWIGRGIAILGPASVYIHDNEFISGPNGGGSGEGVTINNGAEAVIEHNVFDFRPAEHRGIPIDVLPFAEHVVIRNNLILAGDRAILWIQSGTYKTIGYIDNNTIIGPQSDQGGIEASLSLGDTLYVRNNILKDFKTIPNPHNPCANCFVFLHNVYWLPRDTIYNPFPGQVDVNDTGNFSAFPMFVDDSLYRLQAGSPLINTGDLTILDVDGSRSDIGWTGGPGGYTYGYEQMPPGAPDSIWVNGMGGIISVAWSVRPEDDLAEYRLYRGMSSGFWTPDLQPLQIVPAGDIATADTVLVSGESYFYVVTAVDTAGMESEPSPEGMFIVSGVFDDDANVDVPRTPDIVRVYPNPFNAGTVIEIQTPDGHPNSGAWTINIYDILGRRVAILRDDWSESPRQSIEWDGRDANGRTLASGVYFARMMISGQTVGKTASLVIVR